MYTLEIKKDTINLTLSDKMGVSNVIIKYDKCGDLVVTNVDIFEHIITRYNNINEIKKDIVYFKNILNKYNSDNDFSNVFEELFFTNHYKTKNTNHKIVYYKSIYNTIFHTHFGDIIVEDNSSQEIGTQINIFLDKIDTYTNVYFHVGQFNKKSIKKYYKNNNINILKIKKDIETYINENNIYQQCNHNPKEFHTYILLKMIAIVIPFENIMP